MEGVQNRDEERHLVKNKHSVSSLGNKRCNYLTFCEDDLYGTGNNVELAIMDDILPLVSWTSTTQNQWIPNQETWPIKLVILPTKEDATIS